MKLNYDAWRWWLDVVQTLGIVAVGIYGWWRNRERVTSIQLTELGKRITAIEESIKHPKCTIHDGFESRLDTIDKGVSKIEGRMEGFGNALDLIQQHLLNGGK